jgi:hypothetical protein
MQAKKKRAEAGTSARKPAVDQAGSYAELAKAKPFWR